jgi:hypothetical protein
MFSLTLRTKTEAMLPKAARPSCGHSLGQGIGLALPIGWYRGLTMLPVASSLRTFDRAIDCAIDRAMTNCIGRQFQTPEALQPLP